MTKIYLCRKFKKQLLKTNEKILVASEMLKFMC